MVGLEIEVRSEGGGGLQEPGGVVVSMSGRKEDPFGKGWEGRVLLSRRKSRWMNRSA